MRISDVFIIVIVLVIAAIVANSFGVLPPEVMNVYQQIRGVLTGTTARILILLIFIFDPIGLRSFRETNLAIILLLYIGFGDLIEDRVNISMDWIRVMCLIVAGLLIERDRLGKKGG